VNLRHLSTPGLLLALLAACGATSPALPLADVRQGPRVLPLPPGSGGEEVSSREDDEGSRGVGFYLEAYSHPAVALEADEDPGEPGQGIELETDLGTGNGYGVAAGVLFDGIGLGLLYLTSDHTERQGEEEARFHAGFVEALLHGEEDLGWARGTLTLGLGAGVGGVDFVDLNPDSGGTAIEGRLMFGLQLSHAAFEIGGGAFSWGRPGETVGNGTYLAAGLSLWF